MYKRQISVYSAVLAARTEYSSVNTMSSGISTNWLTIAKLVEPVGTTGGRSVYLRGSNWAST